MSQYSDTLYIYSLLFRDFSPEPFGIGLYLLGSLMGHSCVPNCSVTFLGRDLLITAREEIPADQVPSMATISYVSTIKDTKTRNKELMENWFLTCNCSLCLDVT